MTPLADQLSASLAVEPDDPALEWNRTWTTWSDLRDAAERIERTFDDAHLPLDACIGVLARNRPAVIAALVAILRSGRTLVPINPRLPDDALTAELATLDVAALAADPADWTELTALRARTADRPAVAIPFVALGVQATSVEPARSAHRDDRVAVLLGTSGTTGPPKRVPIRYRDIEHALAEVRARYHRDPKPGRPRRPKGVAVLHTPPLNITGFWSIVSELAASRTIALLERFEVDAWVDAVRRHRPVGASIPPAALRMVLDAGVAPEDLESLRAIWSGSAPLDPELAEQIEARYDLAVLPIYGATEFTAGVAGWTLDDWRTWRGTKRGSVGRCQPGVDIRVVDERTGAEVAAGATGLITVRSAHTAGATPEEWVATNDLGALDDDGFVWIVGRADDTINRGGNKIPAAEVEMVLGRHPSVLEAAVIGLPDRRLGQVPVAAVVPAAGHHPSPAELADWVRQHLVAYMVPAEIVVVDELPRNAALKVIRPELASMFTRAPVDEVTA